MACRVDLVRVPQDLLDKVKKMCTIRIRAPAIGKRSRKMFSRQIKCYSEEVDTVTNAQGKLIWRKTLFLPKCFDSMMKKYLFPQPEFRTVQLDFPTHYKLLDANDQLDIEEEKRVDQVQVYEELIQKLADYGTCLFQGSTGYGKTKTIIWALCRIGLPVMVVVHNKKVRQQWVDELGLAGFIVQTSGKPSRGFTAYVYGPRSLVKFNYEDLAGIGVLVMDEMHTCAETAVTNVMLKFSPNFVIGLSGTPYTTKQELNENGQYQACKDSPNNIDDAFPLYYGDKSSWIVRMLKKDFTAFQVHTGIQLGADVPTTALGTINHSVAMAYFYDSPELHEMIYKIICKTGNRRCMVMFERAELGAGKFIEYLESQGETDYSRYYENDSTYKKKKILVTLVQKAGLGFDDPGIEVVMLLCDRNDVAQPEGRLRIRKGGFIFDFVHDRRNQYNHAATRQEWYIKRGGVVKVISGDEIDLLDLDREGFMMSEEEYDQLQAQSSTADELNDEVGPRDEE